MDIFINFGILVPVGARWCSFHLSGNFIKPSTYVHKSMFKKKSISMNSNEIMKLFDDIRKAANHNRRLSFDDHRLTEEDYTPLLGISKDQFNDLNLHVPSMRSSKERTVRNAIGIFLFKMKSGLSNGLIATLFEFKSRRKVAHIIQQARTALAKDFVPFNLGFSHLSRESLVNDHTTDIAKQLFSDPISDTVILVMDGTYVFIQKSSAYRFQRLSYSMHKNRPLVKPFVITSTDGYIVDVMGPYLSNGKNNDSSIIKHIITSNSGDIMDFLKEDDVFIVDRGFRDATPFLNELGFKTQMPSFLQKYDKQHSTTEANMTRFVTKVRWVVEAANGRIKKWKFLNNVVCNSEIPHIKDFIRIICAIINKYRPPLKPNNPEDDEIARQMRSAALSQTNCLQERIARNPKLKFRSKSKNWVSIETRNTIPDFPVLNEEKLRKLTFGVYQLKQARKYSDEHLGEEDYKIDLSCEEPYLLHARIQSRHTSKKLYNIWVEYSKEQVTGWYCECKGGSRTVGCCAHICSVIWYLAFARHNNYKATPDVYTPALCDAADIVLETDSGEESD